MLRLYSDYVNRSIVKLNLSPSWFPTWKPSAKFVRSVRLRRPSFKVTNVSLCCSSNVPIVLLHLVLHRPTIRWASCCPIHHCTICYCTTSRPLLRLIG